ncbi:MAG: RNA-directed DNA polymerase [Anaerolineales bacterium]|nr:RNA-directed DNA polymerase [Anaerolineales bacterium]
MNFLKAFGRLGGRERGLAELARWLGLPETELRPWLSSAPAWARGYDYTRFTIPKRRGGARTIDAPGDKLKALQRRVHQRLLAGLKLNPAATGYVRGRSIVDNARPHTQQAVVINVDLADFFPSITADRVKAVWRAHGWNDEAATALTHICTLDGRLPQGAPTSPALSNLVCRRLDKRLSELARRCAGAYTRYADDLTLSLPSLGRNRRRRPGPPRSGPAQPRLAQRARHSRKIITQLREIIEAEGFRIQWKKRLRLQRAHQRQTATGLVVNAVVNLPRATRRLIRAMQHRDRLGQLDEAGRRRLQGLVNLQQMVLKQRNSTGR